MSDHHDANTEHEVHDHDHGPAGRRGRRAQPAARLVFLVVFAAVIAAIAFVGETLGHSHSASGATITVTGSGTVRGTPDTLSFQVGVQTTAPSAKEALAENNGRVRTLEQTLLSHGVTKQHLQTSGLNIYANTNSMGTITGFSVEDDLDVTMHHLASAGAALDAAANSVGNEIQLNGVTFSISNQSGLLASARARAISNAHTEATQIARGAHTTVGAIARVTDQENSGTTGIVYPTMDFATAAKSVPLEAGSQSINVQVTVVYHLGS